VVAMNRKNIFLILSIFVPPLVLIILRMYFASYLSIFYVNLTVSSIIILIVVSPILEELVFRLFLQDVFLSK
jgi:membrane protease YdiL (CAAX protease family)